MLRDGPPVGVHTIIWCDSVNNMNRTLDRQGMKEFENRILFQMSANDSSTLIDTPAASKLGENRALYYSEEANRIEKFRPYGVPELEWLEGVKKRFDARPRPAVNGQPAGNGDGSAAAHRAALARGRAVDGNGDASVLPPATSDRLTIAREVGQSAGRNPLSQDRACAACAPPDQEQCRRSRTAQLQLRAQRLGRDSTPRTLISSVPISCFAISRLSAFRSSEETSRSSNAREKRAGHEVLSGQVVNPVRDSTQVVLAGEAVEQAGAEQRRIRIVDQSTSAEPPALRALVRTVPVGPGDVFRKPGRPAAGRRRAHRTRPSPPCIRRAG